MRSSWSLCCCQTPVDILFFVSQKRLPDLDLHSCWSTLCQELCQLVRELGYAAMRTTKDIQKLTDDHGVPKRAGEQITDTHQTQFFFASFVLLYLFFFPLIGNESHSSVCRRPLRQTFGSGFRGQGRNVEELKGLVVRTLETNGYLAAAARVVRFCFLCFFGVGGWEVRFGWSSLGFVWLSVWPTQKWHSLFFLIPENGLLLMSFVIWCLEESADKFGQSCEQICTRPLFVLAGSGNKGLSKHIRTISEIYSGVRDQREPFRNKWLNRRWHQIANCLVLFSILRSRFIGSAGAVEFGVSMTSVLWQDTVSRHRKLEEILGGWRRCWTDWTRHEDVDHLDV